MFAEHMAVACSGHSKNTVPGGGVPSGYMAKSNRTGKTLVWTDVRRLAKYGDNTFKYDASGNRLKKNSTAYTLDGKIILKETDGSKTLTYYYGSSGVIGFNYNGTDYYYMTPIIE